MSVPAARAAALEVASRLREAGHQVLFCGGSVRDRLLQRPPKDFDLATSAPPAEGVRLFPRAVTVGARFGVLVVPDPRGDVELATFRSDRAYVDGRRPEGVDFSDPETDASRRDFTVNGLFEDPWTGELIDHVGGRRDLKARLLRAIGDPHGRFEEDHLRILRAVRFAAQLAFAIEPSTWRAVCDMAPEVRTVSAERIREELARLLIAGRGRGLRLLARSGLLDVILPEVAAMRGVPHTPTWHPEGDVFVHTCLVLDRLDLRAVPGETEHEQEQARRDLVFGALLHDVAKPPTMTTDPDGRVRFNAHESLGKDMSRHLLERLRFSKRSVDRVEDLVGAHMKFGHVEQMRPGKLRRFLGDEDAELHLRLHEADCRGSHGRLNALEFCRDRIRAYGDEPVLPDPLLRGRDLLALGYTPGPLLGEILAWVREEQLEGRLDDPAEAARRVRLQFPKA